MFQEIFQVSMELVYCSLFGISGLGMDLYYCDSEWFVLEMNWYHYVILEITRNYCILDYEGHFISSNRLLPKVVDRMVI